MGRFRHSTNHIISCSASCMCPVRSGSIVPQPFTHDDKEANCRHPRYSRPSEVPTACFAWRGHGMNGFWRMRSWLTRSATDFIRSTLSGWRPTGARRGAAHRPTLSATAMNRRWSGCTAATGLTKRWTDERSSASIRQWTTWDSSILSSEEYFTTISRGQRRPPCPPTTRTRTTYPVACASLIGPGTVCKPSRSIVSLPGITIAADPCRGRTAVWHRQ